MSPQERIAILERLLERVKGKGSRPRAAAAAPEPASAVVPAAASRAASPAPPPTVASASPPAASVSPAPPSVAASPAPPPTVASAPPVAPAPPSAPPRAYAAAEPQRPPSEPASGEWATAAAVSSSISDPYPAEPSGDFGADDSLQELELSDEEIVDITVEESDADVPPVAAARAPSSADVEIDMEEEEEESPASSRRARVAASMDEALTGAAEQLEPELEREVPLKTPPPESGPQAALPLPPGLQQPLLPAEYDSGVHPAEEVKVDVPSVAPTHAQLGQTIDLEEPRGPDLELDMRSRAPAAQTAQDELEAALPDASVERMRPSPSALPPAELPEPQRTERVQAHSDVAPASFSRSAKPFTPNTFAELLDASLSLSAD